MSRSTRTGITITVYGQYDVGRQRVATPLSKNVSCPSLWPDPARSNREYEVLVSLSRHGIAMTVRHRTTQCCCRPNQRHSLRRETNTTRSIGRHLPRFTDASNSFASSLLLLLNGHLESSQTLRTTLIGIHSLSYSIASAGNVSARYILYS